ncbi:MAG: DUF4258 domain-containing protein [Acidobacteria bacterium]|nr:DUF4258 domain-containing protein [Acidobacteriota bacterium]
MKDISEGELQKLRDRIRSQAAVGKYRVTIRAHAEMVEEGISLEEVLEALRRGEIMEYYPEHRRGDCCLVSGKTGHGRHLHFFCTTSHPLLILITVYEPRPPKWVTPRQRRNPV